MKTIILATVAVLSLGLAGTASATLTDEIGPQVSSEPSVAQAGIYWQRGSFWRGNCFYRYVYVSNGYAYRYRYVYNCY